MDLTNSICYLFNLGHDEMKYILIIILSQSYDHGKSNSVAIDHIEFDGLNACNVAKNMVQPKLNGKFKSVSKYCVASK